MTQVWFYHLERTPLKAALPDLLDKTLQKGWRAYVLGEGEALADLDQHLWAWREETFLAHGLESEPHAERQPVLLGASGERANAAEVLFSVSAMNLPDLSVYQRCLILFEGQDEAHLSWARAQWKTLKAASADLAYWKQNDNGRWERM
ncbi:DNA polymerase III subunit chi [Asticcacaulis sp. BYS171W]|uniref:DNA polymerase III subunit chi n=1 Tax=Asticcacaulis aquaticus TaxID=2984212 RepID=A0ABT5HNN6_9CAUL|nr:DNA polymerase III subunit chi [Asticcacaulis aquaticus]MDC7681670.1 DNA polymerase III subunit chi [Asticcacaulis aquaticus]